MLKGIIIFVSFLLVPTILAQRSGGSARNFENRCTICHGGNGTGTDRAPSILSFFGSHSDSEIAALIRKGRIEKGMPAFPFTDDEMKLLLVHVRGLGAGEIKAEAERVFFRGGRSLLQ